MIYQPRWIVFCKITGRPLEWQGHDSAIPYMLWITDKWTAFERETGLNRRTSGDQFDKWLSNQ